MINDVQKQAFLEQLKKVPIIQIACEKTGISRASYYRWRKEDEEFKKAADEAVQEGSLHVNDLAESQLIAAIKDRNLTAVQLWLRSHHPQYATKVELSGKVEVDAPLTHEQQALITKALSLVGAAQLDASGGANASAECSSENNSEGHTEAADSQDNVSQSNAKPNDTEIENQNTAEIVQGATDSK